MRGSRLSEPPSDCLSGSRQRLFNINPGQGPCPRHRGWFFPHSRQGSRFRIGKASVPRPSAHGFALRTPRRRVGFPTLNGDGAFVLKKLTLSVFGQGAVACGWYCETYDNCRPCRAILRRTSLDFPIDTPVANLKSWLIILTQPIANTALIDCAKGIGRRASKIGMCLAIGYNVAGYETR